MASYCVTEEACKDKNVRSFTEVGPKHMTEYILIMGALTQIKVIQSKHSGLMSLISCLIDILFAG